MMHQPERMITTDGASQDSDLGHYTQVGPPADIMTIRSMQCQDWSPLS